MKRCKDCGKSAAEGAEFYAHPAFTDKLDNRCKKCRGEIRKEQKRARKKKATAKPDKARVPHPTRREERMPLPMRSAPRPDVDDDEDDGLDEWGDPKSEFGRG